MNMPQEYRLGYIYTDTITLKQLNPDCDQSIRVTEIIMQPSLHQGIGIFSFFALSGVGIRSITFMLILITNSNDPELCILWLFSKLRNNTAEEVIKFEPTSGNLLLPDYAYLAVITTTYSYDLSSVYILDAMVFHFPRLFSVGRE